MVDLSDPPQEGSLRFRIAGVVVAFEAGHGGDGRVGRNVAVDGAVAEVTGWSLFEQVGVGVYHPVDSSVPYRVRTDMNACVVKELDHLAIGGRLDVRIAGVGLAVRGSVGLAIFEPGFIDPGRAATAAAIHEKFDATG